MTPTNDKVDQSGADEREKFEAWYLRAYWDFKFDGLDLAVYDNTTDTYTHLDVNLAYRSWKAALQAQPSAPANPNAALSHDDICKFMPPEFMFGDALQPHHLRDIISAVRSAPANMPARQTLYPMHNEDGTLTQWYFSCDDHYIDVAKDENGLYSIYFRNLEDSHEGWIDQADMPASDAESLSSDDYALWGKFIWLREFKIEDVPLPDLIKRIRAILAPQQPVAASSEPVAWANWKVGTDSYVPFRKREDAVISVNQCRIAATQEGPYEVVGLCVASTNQPVQK